MTYGRSVLTTDIATDPNWVALRHLVMPLGLGVCWSHPIKARDGNILGSMAFYYPPGGQPTKFHRELAKTCIDLCTLAFEHEAAHLNRQRHVYFDELTGLPNRAMLVREMQRTLADCERNDARFSLLLAGLDNLKPLNDTLGHMAGDMVLQSASRLFRSSVGSADFVGRLDGDEFLAVVRHADVADVQEEATRLLQSFQQPLDLAPVHGEKVQISVSIGVAVYPEDGKDVEALLACADDAMRRAKQAGRNRIQFFGGAGPGAEPSAGSSGPEVPGAALAEKPEAKTGGGPSLYGEEVREIMARLSAVIEPALRGIVDLFYEQVPMVPGASYLISHLATEELNDLKTRLKRHLMLLCSPDLDRVRHEEVASHVGHIHAQVGLSRDALANSHSILVALVRKHVDTGVHAQALAIFGQRIVCDLAWQLVVAQQIQLLYSSLLTRITDLAWKAHSYTELISSAAQIIGSLPGVAGCAFRRLDSQYVFQVEALAGEGVAELYGETVQRQVSESIHRLGPNSTPSGWAWRSRVIERCFNFRTDARMVASLPITEKWGFRSCIAIPLVASKEHVVSSVLCIHSRLPGGFSSQEQDMFFSQIQSLLVFGINRLQAWRIAAQAVPFSIRERWVRLLGTDGLEMHYQPIVDLRTGKVVKVEALARLRDADQLLSPDKFFPALSQNDFLQLYENGLNQALQRRQEWIEQGLELDVAINLPNAALEDDRYVDITAWILRRYNCPPTALTLEILEADALSREVDLLQVLERYKGIGVHLAEDDLGSGYSTLARMREIRFDVIKIDCSIVSQVQDDPYNTLCFIHKLTRLGHSLGRTVIVEGIETPDLFDACVALGVDCAQGFVIARPMSAQDFLIWARKSSALGKTPKGYLVLLANVLLWEEYWQMLAQVSGSGYQDTEGLTRRLGQAVLDECFPLPEVYALAKKELIECVGRSGLQSAEYLDARGRLVELLRDSAAAAGD